MGRNSHERGRSSGEWRGDGERSKSVARRKGPEERAGDRKKLRGGVVMLGQYRGGATAEERSGRSGEGGRGREGGGRRGAKWLGRKNEKKFLIARRDSGGQTEGERQDRTVRAVEERVPKRDEGGSGEQSRPL